MKMAINGFGRIGRTAFRRALEYSDIDVVALNDLGDTKTLAHLLQYDTIYGKFEKEVSYRDNILLVDGKEYTVLNEKDPAKLPWKDFDIDVVLECTGVFRTSELAQPHIDAGAKRVIISAPPKDTGISMFVLGANEGHMSADNVIISNASCTTNCIAPVIAILQEAFGVEKAFMTTIHAYTAGQNLVDGPSKDLRRARAAAVNIVPTTTGAAKATTEVVPGFKKFDGMAIRVPVPCGSLSDITALVSKDVSIEDVNALFKDAQKTDRYKEILLYTEEPLVSSDIIGTSYSAIVDGLLTNVVGGNLVKVVAWYDNEWAYSCRLVEQARDFAAL